MAATQFDTTLPSIRQVQNWIKQKATIEIKLVTGDLIIGRTFWQDHNCLCIVDANNEQMIIWKTAIAYMKFSSEGVVERGLVPRDANVEAAHFDS
ncbi:Hfq-related RNA-binding protein [Anabaena azotica]|uniref:Hfq-related RNA-binding protein n=1 Tax=Anabaena azotica TaxID=197653 RepID=UPI0039A4A731